MDLLKTERGRFDPLDQSIRAWASSGAGKAHLEHINTMRGDIDASRLITNHGTYRGLTREKTMRKLGEIPEHVAGFINQFYKKESQKPEFWRWFFRRYPQFRVS